MNILFLTLIDFNSYAEHNIYCDLLREFIKNGHEVYCVSPVERRACLDTHFEENGHLLKLRIGNMQKTNIIEKGISTLRIESQLILTIKKYFRDVKFDLILYSTPPITFASAVQYIKERDNAKTYLLLKDIFPQNAVDLGMITTTGIKSIIYKYFRGKEKKLYAISDHVGCMSQANVDYLVKHDLDIASEKVCVCPNCITPLKVNRDTATRIDIRKQYKIPRDSVVFMYGGNMGKPQNIPFVVECLRATANKGNCFFVMCGTGSDYPVLEQYMKAEKPENVLLINGLPKAKYDELLQTCDVGLLFLDHRFTIPNFPSRMLSYMEHKMPILACTDPNTDVGKVVVNGGFGWWCESDSAEDFTRTVDKACHADLPAMGATGYTYLTAHYAVQKSYETIMEKLR